MDRLKVSVTREKGDRRWTRREKGEGRGDTAAKYCKPGRSRAQIKHLNHLRAKLQIAHSGEMKTAPSVSALACKGRDAFGTKSSTGLKREKGAVLVNARRDER